jgi:hypothetical protein
VRENLEVRSALTASQAAQLGEALTPGAQLLVSWSPDDVMFVEDVHEQAADLDLDPLAV